MTNLDTLYVKPRSPESVELACKMMQEIIDGCKKPSQLSVKKVIFNQDATIVYFNDGTKTVVKRQEDDVWSKEVGMMAAFSKKLFGNDNTFNKIINRYCSPYYHEDKRIQKALEKLARNIETKDGLYRAIYMTGNYQLKRIGYGNYEWVLPDYTKEFMKLAKKHFNVELSAIDLKDNNFKIILREEDKNETQE